MTNVEDEILTLYKKNNLSIQEAVKSLGIMCASGIFSMGNENKATLIKSDELEILITVKRIKHEELSS